MVPDQHEFLKMVEQMLLYLFPTASDYIYYTMQAYFLGYGALKVGRITQKMCIWDTDECHETLSAFLL